MEQASMKKQMLDTLFKWASLDTSVCYSELVEFASYYYMEMSTLESMYSYVMNKVIKGGLNDNKLSFDLSKLLVLSREGRLCREFSLEEFRLSSIIDENEIKKHEKIVLDFSEYIEEVFTANKDNEKVKANYSGLNTYHCSSQFATFYANGLKLKMPQ